jgi:hypothetical protein
MECMSVNKADMKKDGNTRKENKLCTSNRVRNMMKCFSGCTRNKTLVAWQCNDSTR